MDAIIIYNSVAKGFIIFLDIKIQQNPNLTLLLAVLVVFLNT